MRQRTGLTLTEVLVALVILAITGALLLSRTVNSRGTRRAENAGDMKAVMDTARSLAMSRRETLRLRVYTDGLWSVVAPTAPDPIAAGTMRAPPSALDFTIDKGGVCRATPGWIPREELRAAFDAGNCRFETAPVP